MWCNLSAWRLCSDLGALGRYSTYWTRWALGCQFCETAQKFRLRKCGRYGVLFALRSPRTPFPDSFGIADHSSAMLPSKPCASLMPISCSHVCDVDFFRHIGAKDKKIESGVGRLRDAFKAAPASIRVVTR